MTHRVFNKNMKTVSHVIRSQHLINLIEMDESYYESEIINSSGEIENFIFNKKYKRVRR